MSRYICPNCGSIGNPRTYTKGAFLVEVTLWLLCLLPGLIYSMWRLTSRYRGCPSCGAANMVPVDSPHGRKLLANRQQPSASKTQGSIAFACPQCSHRMRTSEEFAGRKIRCGGCGFKFIIDLPTLNEIPVPSNLAAMAIAEEGRRRSMELEEHFQARERAWWRLASAWSQRAYFQFAQLVRVAIDRTIVIRPGVILLVATVSGAVAVLLTESAIGTAVACVVAILVSTAFLYLPSDQTLEEGSRSLNLALTNLVLERHKHGRAIEDVTSQVDDSPDERRFLSRIPPGAIAIAVVVVALLGLIAISAYSTKRGIDRQEAEAKRENDLKLAEWRRNPPRPAYFPPEATPPSPPQQPPSEADSFQGLTEAELIKRLGNPSRVETRDSPDGPFRFLEFDHTKGNETFFMLFVDDGRVFSGMYRGMALSVRDDGKSHRVPPR